LANRRTGNTNSLPATTLSNRARRSRSGRSLPTVAAKQSKAMKIGGSVQSRVLSGFPRIDAPLR
jgi:hypothetical protein